MKRKFQLEWKGSWLRARARNPYYLYGAVSKSAVTARLRARPRRPPSGDLNFLSEPSTDPFFPTLLWSPSITLLSKSLTFSYHSEDPIYHAWRIKERFFRSIILHHSVGKVDQGHGLFKCFLSSLHAFAPVNGKPFVRTKTSLISWIKDIKRPTQKNFINSINRFNGLNFFKKNE